MMSLGTLTHTCISDYSCAVQPLHRSVGLRLAHGWMVGSGLVIVLAGIRSIVLVYQRGTDRNMRHGGVASSRASLGGTCLGD